LDREAVGACDVGGGAVLDRQRQVGGGLVVDLVGQQAVGRQGAALLGLAQPVAVVRVLLGYGGVLAAGEVVAGEGGQVAGLVPGECRRRAAGGGDAGAVAFVVVAERVCDLGALLG